MLVRCSVHTPVRTPMYGLPLNQSDQRIRSVFQSVYNNTKYFSFILLYSCKQKIVLPLHRSNCFPSILPTSISLHNFPILPNAVLICTLHSNWRHLLYFFIFRHNDLLFLGNTFGKPTSQCCLYSQLAPCQL